MQNTQIRRNRILFALWTLVLLILFFFKGQAAVSALLLFTVIYAIAAYLLTGNCRYFVVQERRKR